VARVYHGPTKGDISWRGNLAPGKTVVFGAGGLEEGSPGSALGNKFPSRVKITVTIEPPSVRAQVEPNEANQYNKLVLVNEGATTVTSIEVHWAQVK
jgi:hypothetical protein